jgi:hypothetical protein
MALSATAQAVRPRASLLAWRRLRTGNVVGRLREAGGGGSVVTVAR